MKLLECLPISWIQLYEGSTHRCILVTILQYSLFLLQCKERKVHILLVHIYFIQNGGTLGPRFINFKILFPNCTFIQVTVSLWEKCKYILSPMKSIFKFQCLRIILISQMSIKIGIVCFIQCSLLSFCERTHDYQTKTRRLEVLTHW